MSAMETSKLDPARLVVERLTTPEQSGVRIVAEITGADRTSIYRWMRPKNQGGTGGKIPARHAVKLDKEGPRRGIELPSLAEMIGEA